MKLYRRKSDGKTVDAIQWCEDNTEDVISFIGPHMATHQPSNGDIIVVSGKGNQSTLKKCMFLIKSYDGVMAVDPQTFTIRHESLSDLVDVAHEMLTARDTKMAPAELINKWITVIEKHIGRELFPHE
jgi:uncharacterized protein YgbK (DUF1537 family)